MLCYAIIYQKANHNTWWGEKAAAKGYSFIRLTSYHSITIYSNYYYWPDAGAVGSLQHRAEHYYCVKNCWRNVQYQKLLWCSGWMHCRVWLWYSKFFFATFFNYIDRYNYTQFDLKKKNYILFKTDIGFIKFQSTPLFKDLKEYVMEKKSDQTKCCLLTDCEVKS